MSPSSVSTGAPGTSEVIVSDGPDVVAEHGDVGGSALEEVTLGAGEVIGPGVQLNKSVSPDGAHGLVVQLLSQLRLQGSWLHWERDRNS